MTIAEAAAALSCSSTSVRRWIKANRIAVVRLPSGRLRLYRVDVEAILARDLEPVAS